MDDNAEKWIRAELARIEEKFEVRFDGMDKALELANATLQERFHQINGLREEMNDQRVNFASKDAAKIAAIIYAVLLAAIGGVAFLK